MQAAKPANTDQNLGRTLADAINSLPFPNVGNEQIHISADEIVEAIMGPKNIHSDRDMPHLRLPIPGIGDVAQDIGKDNLALLLVEMGKAKESYLKEHRVFIPSRKIA